MSFEHGEVTGTVIGAAIAVHNELGPGFLESTYEKSLVVELGARGMPLAQQVGVTVAYRGTEVAVHRIDLLVAGQIIVELKAIRTVPDVHVAIVRSYLRAARLTHALLLNFGNERLEIKRIRSRPIPSQISLSSPTSLARGR